MPDETESAVAAWLDNPTTKRELTIARRRLAQSGGDTNHAWLLVLGMEILASLNFYGPDPDAGKQPEDFPDKGAPPASEYPTRKWFG